MGHRPPLGHRPAGVDATRAEHDERLTVPWWGWPLALAVVATFAAPFWLAAPFPFGWLAVAALPAAAACLWWWGRIRVAVVDGVLTVDDARLPARFVADVVPLDAAGRSALLGRDAHPLAFVVQRPWISGAVRVTLDDPADPTPYWLVSSRHPDRLARALLSAAARADLPPRFAPDSAAPPAPAGPGRPAHEDPPGAGRPAHGSTAG